MHGTDRAGLVYFSLIANVVSALESSIGQPLMRMEGRDMLGRAVNLLTPQTKLVLIY